ncbi:Hemin transport protein [Luteimonas salinilitoris]|uniref:Hemin transport protein n=1 Tax=Luteimonas salinilitoris TaxID=3237697 RepID=A0ABV4HUL2_9GAMM
MTAARAIAETTAVHSPVAALPQPRELAALGTVLCLYRAQDGGELAGWSRALRAEVHSGLDSDGLRASLAFHDRDGHCCWRLFLLPDSDFLAWERLASRLPAAPGNDDEGIAERLWRGLAGHLAAPQWQCSVLRLCAPSPGPGFAGHALLAASLATVSALGAAMALRIAREQAAGNAARVHECCCERAARAAADARAATLYPTVQLDTRMPS